MTNKEILENVIMELNYYHSGNILSDKELVSAFDWPDFVTARNGNQRSFTRKSRQNLNELSKIIHNAEYTTVIGIDEFTKIVRQSIADLHAEGEFYEYDPKNNTSAYETLKAEVQTIVSTHKQKFTHYFPAWTLGIEHVKPAPFVLSPVIFMSVQQWIDSVDFPDEAKADIFNNYTPEFDWKEELKKAVHDNSLVAALDIPIRSIYTAIKDCPSVLKIEVEGLEQNMSRKLGQRICKTAIDSVSLAFGEKSRFLQQSLQNERLPPRGTSTLIETNGHLHLPGMSLSQRVPSLPADMIQTGFEDIKSILPAFENILDGQLNPTAHNHAQLCNRWAVALDWFAEGKRESNDAVALAKIATSLDVLACVGKYKGILEMLSHLFGISADEEIIKKPQPITLKKLVKTIYDEGRSKILHGTQNDRMKKLDAELNQASYLARNALILCASRLLNYSGDDSDTAFRTI